MSLRRKASGERPTSQRFHVGSHLRKQGEEVTKGDENEN